MDPKPLSVRICILLILFFGIAAYSNTFTVPFQYDDVGDIVENQTLRPPLDIGRIWHASPSRFIALLSFAFQFALTGSAPWGFHAVNLLIHLLTTLIVFGATLLLLRTPALRGTLPPSQHTLFALATALLFLTHPVQTEAVTYIVQRLASLATLFYLATLWLYLKARLEDSHHYRLVFCFMLAAMMTKEICFTLPLAILLVDFCFFPVSDQETVFKKIRRWLPFAALFLVIPLFYYFSSSGKFVGAHGAVDTRISWADYLLTQFRVLRTYLRLLIFPAGQCIDYDYRISSGWGDPDTWAAFSLLFSLLLLALASLKKFRLLSFGILWFFLTLSVESSLIPLKDVLVEHRLYLPMFGFSLFLAFLLWQCARSASRFLAVILVIAVAASGMTYARNEVWKSPFTLWQDTIQKSPHKFRPYAKLGEAYAQELKDDKTALFYYQKALQLGWSAYLLSNTASAYFRLGHIEKGTYYQNRALASTKSENRRTQDILSFNQAVILKKENKIPEAITTLKKALETSPQNPSLHVLLGELYRVSGDEAAAITSFREAIQEAPLYKGGYDALALFYKEKGEKQKALAVILEYLKLKKKQGPLFGN